MSIFPKLNRFDLSMIVISLVVGMGIFATPAKVSVSLNTPVLYFGAWVFGGIISLFGALTFAEIGARYPAAGGFYKAFSYCFHPALAFMINWVLVISNAASVAAVAIIGAQYIQQVLLPNAIQGDVGIRIISISAVLLLYLINLIGIRMSAQTQNLLTIVKIGIILVICTAIFKNETPAIQHALPPPLVHKNTIYHFGEALIAIFFTYGGYQQTINFGGDSINAKVNIPKAIWTGMLAVIGLYLLVNYAYYKCLGLQGMQHEPALAAVLAGFIFGATGYKMVSVLMFVSVLAYINVNILANPRIYYAMAEDGMLPARFKHINARTQIQEFGLSFFVMAIVIVLCFITSFEKLLNYVMFFDTIGLSTAALSIFILRKKTRHLDGSNIYRIKWYPIVPLIFITTYWLVTVYIFIKNPMAALTCLCAFAAGLIIYFITKFRRQSS